MKLHSTLIEKLLRIYTTYGGYREETRLKTELENLNLMAYTQQTGNEIIVDSDDYQKEAQTIAQSAGRR